jgi:hypothetical protein
MIVVTWQLMLRCGDFMAEESCDLVHRDWYVVCQTAL